MLPFAIGLALVGALAIWIRASSAKFEKHKRSVVRVFTEAGYTPFGPAEGSVLTFRSNLCRVQVEWDRGYVAFAIAPQTGLRGWISERVLREALFGEEWDPAVRPPAWNEDVDFAGRLSQRLDLMGAAVIDDDRRAMLLDTEAKQTQRWQDYLGEISHAAQVRRAKGKDTPARSAKPPSWFWAYVGPYFVITVAIGVVVGLVILDDRYPQRGFNSALGAAWVVVPVGVTIYFLIARDWREQLRSSKLR